MSDVAILIPAAGASSRMRGDDKLLEQVDGRAQLARVAGAALASGAPVLVTLAPGQSARAAVLPRAPRLQVIEVPDAAEGMAASLRRGVAHSRQMAGLMILPADMPEMEDHDIQVVIRYFSSNPAQPCRATDADGTPGHPVVLPARLFPAMAALKGDAGARGLLRGEVPRLLALPGRRATTDLDTPEDWARWRAARNR